MADILCGPLLRYTWTDHSSGHLHGSALIVTNGDNAPTLDFQGAELIGGAPKSLMSEPGRTFWRYDYRIQLDADDKEVKYTIQGRDDQYSFWVPSKDESMRILFHSCNGFSVGIKPDAFAGPSLWNDVLQIHTQHPFHVMIGGGDQVYSDAVRTEGPLQDWAKHMSPRKRARVHCDDELEKKLDDWYFNNYCKWYTTAPFNNASARIMSVQLYDDHDIIDGFGSYPDRFMKAPIFLAIGRVAYRYYMLFQQQTPPNGEKEEDPSWLIGPSPGPYIQEKSRSIVTTLGPRILFAGLDCRTERTLKDICYKETYDAFFARMEKDITSRNGEINHVIVLLGVPIAYPRLVWAEKFLSAHTITPLRLLNKLFGIAGGMFNKFDGGAELLDDLNDHWCAGNHKHERNKFVKRLQGFAKKHSVRITILGGDVHLAAIGRFFSKESLKIPQNKDERYMVNVISSAITNAPPPMAVANALNQRNKLHHLDEHTDENLMALFMEEADGKTNRINHTTMAARNYCIIAEHAGLTASSNGNAVPETDNQDAPAAPASSSTQPSNGDAANDSGAANGDALGGVNAKQADVEKQRAAASKETPHEDMLPAVKQTGGFANVSAAAPATGTSRKFALDVSLRVEIDPKDSSGKTRPYGFTIPCLES